MRMELFQKTQLGFAVLGIIPNQPTRTNPLNEKILKTYLIYLSNCAFFSIYLFHVAKNFQECMIIAFMTSTAFVTNINYTILVLQSQRLFEYINKFEETIEKRE